MPTFATLEPIKVTLGVSSGQALIVASDRADTVVRIAPGNPSSAPDVNAADQTLVEFSEGRLLVTAPEPSLLNSSVGKVWKDGSIDVRIDVPTGSSLEVNTVKAEIRADGLLGDCELNTVAGPIHLGRTGTLHAETADGSVTIEHVTGYAKINAVTGKVRIGEIDGSAVISSVNGDIWLGGATDDLDLGTVNGSIVVDRADANVKATTANGSIRAGQLKRGQVELMTAAGDVEVGVRDGSAAWIDAHSKIGSVRNFLAAQANPDKFLDTVQVRARTRSGDIVIRRSGNTL